MENNIGVGIVLGIALATSLYVWNSNDFSKTQKYILLLFILFPPLQWVSILIVLAYNKYQTEKTVQVNTISQNIESKKTLDIAKNNLIELKEKGIITEKELNSKVKQIENQKKEFDIKNSTEYKQLKSLLDSGVLSEQEFESKINFIKKTPIKKINSEELERLENYVESIKTPKIEEPKKKNYSYVYFILLTLILILTMFFIAHLNESNVESNHGLPEVAPAVDNSYENNQDEKESIKNKYGNSKEFVFFTIECVRNKFDFDAPNNLVVINLQYCSKIIETSTENETRLEENFRNCPDLNYPNAGDKYGLKVKKETLKIYRFPSHEEALKNKNLMPCDETVTIF